jgi:hypothetical protein
MVTMTLRTQRRLLWAVAALLALASAGAGVGFVLWPLERLEESGGSGAPSAKAQGETDGEGSPLSAYAVIYERDLQRPLFDPKPVAPEEKPPPKPTVTLVGTVIAPDAARAVLKTNAGRIKMATVGQTVDGAEVLEVTADSATIRFAGHTHTLAIQKGAPGS